VWRTRTPFLVRHPWILDWLDWYAILEYNCTAESDSVEKE
jgi:hypothetical protein